MQFENIKHLCVAFSAISMKSLSLHAMPFCLCLLKTENRVSNKLTYLQGSDETLYFWLINLIMIIYLFVLFFYNT